MGPTVVLTYRQTSGWKDQQPKDIMSPAVAVDSMDKVDTLCWLCLDNNNGYLLKCRFGITRDNSCLLGGHCVFFLPNLILVPMQTSAEHNDYNCVCETSKNKRNPEENTFTWTFKSSCAVWECIYRRLRIETAVR